MSKFMRDPDLEQLVEELNDSGALPLPHEAGEPSRGLETPVRPAQPEVVDRWLARMLREGATDRHLVAGAHAVVRDLTFWRFNELAI